MPTLLLASLTLLTACGASRTELQTETETAWQVRETAEPDDWVVYERDASVADVKEFRIIGVIDATPDVVVEALRVRLVDDQYLPDGLEREILIHTDDEIVLYGRMPMPFPMNDLEATERISFTHEPDTGVFRVDARELDPGDEPPQGVTRIPVVRNTFVLAPTADGGTELTNTTLHDVGNGLLNRMIYAPSCDQLVQDLATLRELAQDG